MTSEPQTLASEAAQEWGIDFDAIGDPHHEVREICKERGWLELFYNEDAGHLTDRPWLVTPRATTSRECWL